MKDPDEWPGSIIDTVILRAEIAKFLRTHRDGHELLYRYFESIPQDRTEQEYLQEREQAAVAHENAIAKFYAMAGIREWPKSFH